MSEAAEQHDENNAMKEECASLRSSVKSLESDEAGSLQRILGLERTNHTLESQVAHFHGRIRDEYNLAMDQLSIKASRLNELEAMAYDFNSETQQLRTESREISASLRKAIEATNEYQSMINAGTDFRTRLRTSSRDDEARRVTTQAKLRGAEMYHNNKVTDKDGQIQALRDQTQHLSGSESREVVVPICREAGRS